MFTVDYYRSSEAQNMVIGILVFSVRFLSGKNVRREYKPDVNSIYQYIINSSHAVCLLYVKTSMRDRNTAPMFPNVALGTRSNRLVLELPGEKLRGYLLVGVRECETPTGKHTQTHTHK